MRANVIGENEQQNQHSERSSNNDERLHRIFGHRHGRTIWMVNRQFQLTLCALAGTGHILCIILSVWCSEAY